jgi:ATP-dependent RNA helicase RhlE
VEILVLDRMLDMGFLRDIERILKSKSKKCFPAFSKDIKKLAMGILHKPVQVTPENTTVDAITKKVYLLQRKKQN